jgi:hypothetical protein
MAAKSLAEGQVIENAKAT